ncbi:MAG: hypothetical protein ACRDVP_11620 [Acidimicrobiales bacterium]
MSGPNADLGTPIHLERDEANELARLLDGALGEMSSEIADTDNPSYARELRARRELLRSALSKIHGAGG